jgi:hypothetical protein
MTIKDLKDVKPLEFFTPGKKVCISPRSPKWNSFSNPSHEIAPGEETILHKRQNMCIFEEVPEPATLAEEAKAEEETKPDEGKAKKVNASL